MKMQENHRITLNLSREEHEIFLKFFDKIGYADGFIDTCLNEKESEIFHNIVRIILKPVERDPDWLPTDLIRK